MRRPGAGRDHRPGRLPGPQLRGWSSSPWRSPPGLAIPLLLVARLGAGVGRRLADRMPTVRRVAGAVLVVNGPGHGVRTRRCRAARGPGLRRRGAATARGQRHGAWRAGLAARRPQPADSCRCRRSGSRTFDECEQDSAALADCGPAPEFTGIVDWLNTPGDEPLTIAGLSAAGPRRAGRLLDLLLHQLPAHAALPHRLGRGLPRPGPDRSSGCTPRSSPSSARWATSPSGRPTSASSTRSRSTTTSRTWRAYDQRYWPAHYLIDRTGTVRQVHYGEGAYEQTEALIRELLAEDGAPVARGRVHPGDPGGEPGPDARDLPRVRPAGGPTPTQIARDEPADVLRRSDCSAGSARTGSRSAAPGPCATSGSTPARRPG